MIHHRPRIGYNPEILRIWLLSSVAAVGLYWLAPLGGLQGLVMSIPGGVLPFIALIVSIKQTPISMVSIILAVSGLISIATFGGSIVIPVLIAFSILFGGLTLSERYHLEAEEEEVDLEQSVIAQKTGYIAAALVVFTLVNVIVPQIKFTQGSVLSVNTFFGANGKGLFTSVDIGTPPSSILNFSSLDPTTQGKVTGAFLFGVFLIPVAEEQFFRGFFANWFLSKTDDEIGIAMLANGAVFAGFHVAVYGFNPYTMTIIGVSGAVLTYIDWATGDIGVSTAAHVSNNALSFLAGGSVLVVLFGQLGIPLGNLLPQTVSPVVLTALTLYKIKRKEIKIRC